jgi:hypothetical protein
MSWMLQIIKHTYTYSKCRHTHKQIDAAKLYLHTQPQTHKLNKDLKPYVHKIIGKVAGIVPKSCCNRTHIIVIFIVIY